MIHDLYENLAVYHQYNAIKHIQITEIIAPCTQDNPGAAPVPLQAACKCLWQAAAD